MRRALSTAAVLWAALAFAGWHEVTTAPGTPEDLTVTDGGVVVLATSTSASAWRVSDAGAVAVAQVDAGAIGAGFFGADCLAAVGSNRQLRYSAPACGTATEVAFGTSARRFRLTPTQSAVVTVSVVNQLYGGPGADGPWTALRNFQSPGVVESLNVTRLGTLDVIVATGGLQQMVLSLDGGAAVSLGLGTELRDLSPFERLGVPAVLVVSIDGGFALAPQLTAPVLQPVALPAGEVVRFVSASGLRGLASTASGGVLSPIPNPSAPGETWVARVAAPALTGRVHCVDGRWCAGFAGNVAWALENAAAPTVAVTPPPARFGEPVRLVADAGDADGDPVFVTWATTAGALAPVAGVADGTQVDLVPACEATVPLDVTVSDGVSSVVVPVSVAVERRGEALGVGPPSVLAGGDAGRFALSVDGGCLAPIVTWSSPTGQGGAGASFDWVPPATACDAAGTTATVTATVTWPGGLGSSSVAVDTLVLPWGAPEAPVFPSPAQQRSGTSRDWSPLGATHACETELNFPGTELLWALDGGALATPVDGGLRVTAPSSCMASTVRFEARRQVIGEQAGRVSPPGELVIELTPDFDALDATAVFSVTALGDGGVLSGELTVAASCLAERSLDAEVVISQAGVALASGRFPVPGPWALQVPGSCSGGQFDVTAALAENGADTGARATAMVTTGLVPVALGLQRPERLEVQCGLGAAGEVSLEPVAGTCSAAAFSWRVVSGPAVEQATGQGATASVQTLARDWSAAGQVVTLEWSADAGAGNALTEQRQLVLGVAPFLSASSRIDPVIVEEQSVFRARATIKNPTACPAEGLQLELQLSGAVPVEGTTRLGGAPVEAAWRDGAVSVEGLSVPAGGEVELELLARPRLLGRPALAATARLNGQLVTLADAPWVIGPGCGCSGGPGGLGLALLACVLRWRRRAARVGCRR